ncbi:MAG TPA: DUF4384 domain-containing protein [Thioploca sp.]|nr:MAG: hypothetical protein DRR19_02245 [Gammaproteobacteria bacterium]HDN26057.1 DUF4384 domain-containing protein [Thioploca sp.]
MKANRLTVIISGMIVAISQLLVGYNVFAASAQPLSIDIKYVYRHKGGNQFETLTEGSTLYSGDYYKIIFTPTETTYVYIFQTDSSENIFRLFPMKSFGGVTVNNFNPAQPGKTYYIPAKGQSFYLDQQIGEEAIYFITSRQPEPRLENQYQQVVTAQRKQDTVEVEIAQTTLQQEIQQRGPGGIEKDSAEAQSFNWQEKGQQFSTLRQRLEGCDGCVNVLKFWHR